MHFPDIHFTLGRNAALESHPQHDPSGLRHALTDQKIETLCGIANEEAKHVLASAEEHSPGIIDALFLPKEIELYAMNETHPSAATACLKQTGPMIAIKGLRTQTPTATLSLVPEVDGILVRASADMLEPQFLSAFRKRIGHEILHVFLKNGMSPYMCSKQEALMHPLGEKIYGPDDSPNDLTNQEIFNWDPQGIIATDGFSEPDFAATVYESPLLQQMLYVLGPLAFIGIDVKKVWQIWRALVERANNTGYYPHNHQIRETIAYVLQEQSGQVLGNPNFRTMEKEGPGILALQAADKRCAMVFPFFKIQNPHFGLDASKNYDPHCFIVRENPNAVSFSHSATGASGHRELGSGLLGTKEMWSFGGFKKTAEERLAPALAADIMAYFKKDRVGKMTYNIQGVGPIEIHRSDKDPWKD